MYVCPQEQSDCAQMHFLSIHMEPILHAGCPHNCQDLLSWLPSYVTEHILTYLDPGLFTLTVCLYMLQ